MKPRPWTVERVESRGDYRVFTVDALHARREGDVEPHVFFRINSSSWVNVVSLTPEREFVMVRQYRQGSASVTLEIPGGLVDDGEDPATAAARELEEETGFRPASVRKIGQVNPNPALFANAVHTYVAEGCVKVGEVKNDSAEETVVAVLTEDEVHAAAAAGEVDHALVLAALYWLDRDARER
jgi:8-oxo-dGTP pyrophosphatase MutT (NUDIX family)